MFYRVIPKYALIWFISVTAFSADDLVINEIHYNPAENDLLEFVEIYNPTSHAIDLSAYAFTNGIRYSFPQGVSINPGEYIVVARTPMPYWYNKSYQVLGPYEGKLDNGGEKLTLSGANGQTVDEVKYGDFTPWPRNADGYGSSLERISPDLPSDDYHSWRASLRMDYPPNRAGGTPGEVNASIGVPPKPMILSWQIDPSYPKSNEKVTVQTTLDGVELIGRVSLLVEKVQGTIVNPTNALDMELTQRGVDRSVFQTIVPPCESQTLVRMAIQIQMNDGRTLVLPHSMEPRPFESYFVYDGEIPSFLPLMWIYPDSKTRLFAPSRKTFSGVVIKPATADHVEVHDGARIERRSFEDKKIHFLHREEFNGNRTLNLMAENPFNGDRPSSPHLEQFAYRIFRDFDVLAPQCDWFRVIEGNQHTQNILIQQPNEEFLQMNGRDPGGNIYKVVYGWDENPEKKTHTDEGNEDYAALRAGLYQESSSAVKEAVLQFLNIDKVMAYSVAGVLTANWDGFFNNLFLYHDPQNDRWECIPWDLDQTLGCADDQTMFAEMPVDYPLDGFSPVSGRPPGFISKPFHGIPELHEEYKRRLRSALDSLFSQERMDRLIDETEKLLLEDLVLQENYTGESKPIRREQITSSYAFIRDYVRLRHTYLRNVLPVAVDDWPLY